MKSIIAIALIFLVSGCSRTELINKMAPADKKAQAIEILEALRKGTGEETFARLPTGQRSEEAENTLALLAQGIPDQDFSKMTFVDYQWKMTGGKNYYYFVFEYDFNGRYLLADITIGENEEDGIIAGLHVNELKESVVESSKFDFNEAGTLHFGFFGVAILFPIFSIVTLVSCIRTKGIKRKWLWCIFIVVGITAFELNWNSGAWSWAPMSFGLFSGSAMSAGAHGPWIIGFNIPLGAILFWHKRKKVKAKPVAGANTTH